MAPYGELHVDATDYLEMLRGYLGHFVADGSLPFAIPAQCAHVTEPQRILDRKERFGVARVADMRVLGICLPCLKQDRLGECEHLLREWAWMTWQCC